MDPSNSFESQAFVNANQPEQTESISCMDRNSYYAAAEGKIVVFKDITDQSLDLSTPNKKKILHIYIKTLNSGSESTTQPSSSFESQTETITCMSCDSYNAAANGNIDFFKANTDRSLDLTPNKNTILHIYITALNSESNSTTPSAGSESTTTLNTGAESTTPNTGSESTATLNSGSESTANFVEEILEMCSSLLWQANAKGETPLHIAARYGHDGIVKVLITYCAQRPQTLHDQDLEEGIEPVKEMLRMTNKEKDTALHEAVRYNHLKVVELLIEQDPDFSYSANDAGETPLYIAAERKFKDVLFKILNKCKSPIMHGGPLGRTALHAAVIQRDIGMVRRILEKIDGISRKVDNNSWTPLHLAACFNEKNFSREGITKLLLDKDREVAYMKDTKGLTPLHIAAQCGNIFAILIIVEMCPDCCELVDNRGWNVLHFLIKGRWPLFLEPIMEIIIQYRSFSNLLNEKNADGDTPLHFYSNSTSSQSAKKFISHPRLDQMAFNKDHLNATEIASTGKKMSKIRAELGQLPQRVITFENDTTKQKDEDGDEKDEDKISLLRNAAGAHLVVAALITTVTFAACITMPGGFTSSGEGSHPGSALLRKNAIFKAFVITDTISMVLSSSAVFIHLLMPFLLGKNYNKNHCEELVNLAFYLIFGAMITMGLAFITGTYAVLMPSLDLAIANCIICLAFFAIIFLVIGKLIKDMISNLKSDITDMLSDVMPDIEFK